MKKLFKGTILSLLAVSLLAGSVGCGGGDKDSFQSESVVLGEDGQILDVSGSLSLRIWEGGFGVDYMNDVIGAFNRKYPNVKVSMKPTTLRNVIFQEIVGSSVTSNYDLYIADALLSSYADQFEDLSDVFAYKWAGETQTIQEKMFDVSIEDSKTKDGKIYRLPTSVTPFGIAYNAELITEEDIPVTTNELENLCKSLKSTITPIIFSGDQDCNYWTFLYDTWYIQYQSLEEFKMAEIGKVKQNDGTYAYDKSSAYLEGSLKAMEVCEKLLTPENGYVYSKSVGTAFMTAQQKFFKGEAAMMANGSWMLNEMSEIYPDGPDYEMKLMKVPVISSIIEKTPSVGDDAELAALVKAIDAGATAFSGDGYEVTESDFNYVKNARTVAYTLSGGYGAVMPKSAQNKTIAKLFLQYLYSDEAIQTVVKAKAGNFVPVKGLDYSSLYTGNDNSSIYLASCAEQLTGTELFYDRYNLQAVSQICIDPVSITIERQFASPNKSDRVSALASYNAKKAQWTDEYYERRMNEFGYYID